MERSKNDTNSSVPATAGAVTPPVRTIIGRYFDRVASDTSGLTFEEWAPPDGSSFIINATELRAVKK